MVYHHNTTFSRKNILEKGEYDNCVFTNCILAHADLSELKFMDCVFRDCDLSMTKLNKTSFQNISFKDCKMLGFRIDTCNEFGLMISFEGCSLQHSSFYRKKIKKTLFFKCQLQETDFTECDLSGTVFDSCDLDRAQFANTILEKTDFRTAFNYSFDPEKNKLKKARFSISGVTGLLHKYDIEIEA